MSSSSSLTVLCIPMTAVGHVNPMLAIASAIKARGHQVTIATEKSWQGKFAPLGFREEIFEEKNSNPDKGPASHWVDLVQRLKHAFRQDPYEAADTARDALKGMATPFDPTPVDARIGEIIQMTKPDIIVYDGYSWHSSVLLSDVPVVQVITTHPLMVLDGGQLPPATFGLSIYSDPSTWTKYIEKRNQHRSTGKEARLEQLKAIGAPTPRSRKYEYLSTNLNVLIYPRPLAKYYLERSDDRQHFFVVDHALRPTDTVFQIPKKLQEMPGRFVFLSMGSLGSSDVDLMKILVSSLAKAAPKYKFIVAKGAMHDQYELADNMWGDRYVPQLGVLPLVDLAIIHGGNNSFTETLYFGKPMIVIPLFFDQRDNAELAVDVKIGAKFNPFKQSGEELILLMDSVLNNEEILSNVKAISTEMQGSKSMDELVDRIENVVKHPKKPVVF